MSPIEKKSVQNFINEIVDRHRAFAFDDDPDLQAGEAAQGGHLAAVKRDKPGLDLALNRRPDRGLISVVADRAEQSVVVVLRRRRGRWSDQGNRRSGRPGFPPKSGRDSAPMP